MQFSMLRKILFFLYFPNMILLFFLGMDLFKYVYTYVLNHKKIQIFMIVVNTHIYESQFLSLLGFFCFNKIEKFYE